MSSPSQVPRKWRFYVTDIIEFAEKVISYTGGKNRAAFVAHALTYDATLRNLELIGEEATHIPNAVQEAHSGIPWRAIIGARNRLAHGYLSMNENLIWTMIQDAIPKLLPELQNLLDKTSKDPE